MMHARVACGGRWPRSGVCAGRCRADSLSSSPFPHGVLWMAKRPAKPEIETVAFVSLGCPKNLVDSERMLGLLAGDGIVVTSDASNADAIVINTCGFLEASKDES